MKLSFEHLERRCCPSGLTLFCTSGKMAIPDGVDAVCVGTAFSEPNEVASSPVGQNVSSGVVPANYTTTITPQATVGFSHLLGSNYVASVNYLVSGCNDWGSNNCCDGRIADDGNMTGPTNYVAQSETTQWVQLPPTATSGNATNVVVPGNRFGYGQFTLTNGTACVSAGATNGILTGTPGSVWQMTLGFSLGTRVDVTDTNGEPGALPPNASTSGTLMIDEGSAIIVSQAQGVSCGPANPISGPVQFVTSMPTQIFDVEIPVSGSVVFASFVPSLQSASQDYALLTQTMTIQSLTAI
jgi:hypothetical protein